MSFESKAAAFKEIFNKPTNAGYALTLAWSLSEAVVNGLVSDTFNMDADDPKTELFEDIPFWKKLQFLKDFDVITEDERKALESFSKRRNKLFHSEGDKVLDFVMNTGETQEFLKHSTETITLILAIIQRKYGTKAIHLPTMDKEANPR